VRWTTCAVLFLAIYGAPLQAQLREVQPSDSPRVCRSSTDPKRCGGRALPEFLGYIRLTGDDRLANKFFLGIAFGYTHSTGTRSGVGAKFYLAAHDGASAGVMAVYRRWTSENAVLEIDVGTPLAGETRSWEMQIPSIVTEISYSYKDWIGVSAGVNVVRYGTKYSSESFTDVGVHVGAKVGRGLGVLGYLAALIFVGAVAATCC